MAKTPIKLNASEKAIRIVKRNYSKDGKEAAALEAISNATTAFQATLGKEKANLQKEIAILELELADAQRNATPTQAQIERAKLDVEKAEQALEDKFERAYNAAVQEFATTAMVSDVPMSFMKELYRTEMKDETLEGVQREVAAVKAAKTHLDSMSETTEVLAFRRGIATLTEQIATIDMFLQASQA